MAASDVYNSQQTLDTADVVPNGGIGVDQYLEAASKYVQAYERSMGGVPVFSGSLEGPPAPQLAHSVWEPNLGSGKCGPTQVDVTAAHDPGNSVWVLSTTANIISNGQNTKSFVCIAVSLGEDLLNKSGNFQSKWNGYAFDLGLDNGSGGLLPVHNGVPDIADYARFGAFGGPTDGSYYITFDLINQNATSYGLEGFGVCQIPQAQLQGGGTNSPNATCYRYVVPASQLTNHPSLIHTLLPADADSNSFASNTAGEYFVATENPDPGNNNNDVSDSLAFWTWNMITDLQAEIDISVGSSFAFTPGCYNRGGNLENTFCAVQKDSAVDVDGLGDRLMSRLAYRNLVPNDCSSPRDPQCGEVLAVTQTIAVSSNNPFGQTQVRYYTIHNPSQSSATIEYEGQVSNSSLYYYMPSNAIDKNGNVGYTFTGSDSATHPHLYLDTLSTFGVAGTAEVVPGLTFNGSENGGTTQDGNQFWGEYVSTTIDPSDDLTFWSVGEYFKNGDQSGCTGPNFPTCSWYTAIFSCKKGDSNCP